MLIFQFRDICDLCVWYVCTHMHRKSWGDRSIRLLHRVHDSLITVQAGMWEGFSSFHFQHFLAILKLSFLVTLDSGSSSRRETLRVHCHDLPGMVTILLGLPRTREQKHPTPGREGIPQAFTSENTDAESLWQLSRPCNEVGRKTCQDIQQKAGH